MKTKYIRNQSRFVVFPEHCQHRDMAMRALGPEKLIHGAGFMELTFDGDVIQAECYGHSISLNTPPRRDDHVHILASIGVSGEPAKYIVWRDSAVVFSNQIQHEQVANAAFDGRVDSAGYVKFSVELNGRVKIECYGEGVGVSARSEDRELVAELMKIPAELVFVPPSLKM